MSILGDVFKELFKMFVADLRLTIAILAMVAGAAALVRTHATDTTTAGLLMTAGLMAILAWVVIAETRRRSRH